MMESGIFLSEYTPNTLHYLLPKLIENVAKGSQCCKDVTDVAYRTAGVLTNWLLYFTFF